MSSEANAHVTSSFSFQKHVIVWECNGFVIVRFDSKLTQLQASINFVIHNKNNLLLQELEPLLLAMSLNTNRFTRFNSTTYLIKITREMLNDFVLVNVTLTILNMSYRTTYENILESDIDILV